MNTEPRHVDRRGVAIALTAVIGLSIVGAVRGIREGVPVHEALTELREEIARHNDEISLGTVPPGTMPATSYARMRRADTGPTARWRSQLPPSDTEFDYHRCITCHDPHTLVVQPDEQAKAESLKLRATRRAYNGAPPVVPHAVAQTNDAACTACHQHGIQVGELAANAMPHGFLPNCLQCHAPPPPETLVAFYAPPENLFAGLPTPTSGPRAYPGAPPLIPHSTWMRQDCLSCHGGSSGWPGLEVTHRWRTHCLQCHGTSSSLEQAFPPSPFPPRETTLP